MKKLFVFGVASILVLGLLLVGCGKSSKSENTQPDKPSVKQSQDMNNMDYGPKGSNDDMKNMDHSKMNMDGNK